jgi:neurofibromin 1
LISFFLQNPRKQGPETQGSTAELITGLVQLVPQSHMPEIAQEAMEVRGKMNSRHSLLFFFLYTSLIFFRFMGSVSNG